MRFGPLLQPLLLRAPHRQQLVRAMLSGAACPSRQVKVLPQAVRFFCLCVCVIVRPCAHVNASKVEREKHECLISACHCHGR